MQSTATKEKESMRIVWVDLLKALGLLLVMVGHIPNSPQWLTKLIFSFHIPLFFLLSGFTSTISSEMNLKGSIEKKFYSLVKPYFTLSFFLFPLWFFTIVHFEGASWVNTFISGLKGIFLSQEGKMTIIGLWFLPALFLSYVLVFFVYKAAKGNLKCISVVMLLFAVLGNDSYRGKSYHMPWHLNTAFIGASFIFIGILLRLHYDKIEKTLLEKFSGLKYWGLVTLFVVIGVFTAFSNAGVDMNKQEYGSLIYFYIAALSAVAALILVARKAPYIKPLDYVGKNTLLILGIHWDLQKLLLYIFPVLKRFRYNFLLIIVLYFCLIPATWCVNKYLPFVVGRTKKKTQ